MKYKVYRLNISVKCMPYDRLHSEMRTIITESINKEFSVDMTDVLFETKHQLKYNSFTHMIQYTLVDNVYIDEKTHHKLVLLNSDYTRSTRVPAWYIARSNDEAKFYFSVEECDD